MSPCFRLLIVDDNVSIHEDYFKILVPETSPFKEMESKYFGNPSNETHAINYQIDSAYQGEEALKMVKKAVDEGKPYALAFMDVIMPPGWDGIETIKRIWEVDPYINMVICTAYGDRSWNDLVDNLGINDKFLILKKPFENIEVRQLACCLTQKWSLTQEVGSKYDRLTKEVMEETEKLKKMFEKNQPKKEQI